MLTDVPRAAPRPGLFDAAGAGEERLAAFVDRNGQYHGVVVETPLNPIPVVSVQIDIGDPAIELFAQPSDRDTDVIVDAESRCRLGWA